MTDERGDLAAMAETHAERIAHFVEQYIERTAPGVSRNKWALDHGITPSNLTNWSSGKTPHIELAQAYKLGAALGMSALDVLRIGGYEELGNINDVPDPVLPPVPTIDEAINSDPDPLLNADDRARLRDYVELLRSKARGDQLKRSRPQRKR